MSTNESNIVEGVFKDINASNTITTSEIKNIKTPRQTRMEELKNEYDKGTAAIKDLQEKTSGVNSQMLRIQGAYAMLAEQEKADAPVSAN